MCYYLFLLQKEGGGVDENDDINSHEVFEEYEWAGQTRIRATSLLEGGFRGIIGTAITVVLQVSCERVGCHFELYYF